MFKFWVLIPRKADHYLYLQLNTIRSHLLLNELYVIIHCRMTVQQQQSG